jgi:PAS domain S-box-containing protein
MPDAPLDPVRAELERLRARVSELETQLATHDQQQPTNEPQPEPDARDRRQAEQALRDREEHYRQLLETLLAVPWEGAVPDLSADPPPPFTFRYVGPQAKTLLGYPLDDWYTPGFWEQHLHPNDREWAVRLCLEATRRGEDHDFEYRMVRADGGIIWVFDVVRVVLVEGRPRMLRGFLVDITERKKTELALRQSKEWLQMALEAAGVLMYVVDLPGGQLTTSADLATYYGAPPGLVLDRMPEALAVIHPEDRPAAEERFRLGLSEGRDSQLEFRGTWPGPDGEPVWFHAGSRVQCDDSGRPIRMVGLVVNVTARKRAEQERLELEARMYQSQHLESLGVLAGGIAHEFNNLLTTLMGYTDLAQSEVPADLPAHAYLNEVMVAGRRASELTQQILAYAGKGRFVLQPVLLPELVQQMTPLLTTIVSRKATLRLDTAAPTPPVEGDVSQLRQVILNLVSNASEALGEQDGMITLRTARMDLTGESGSEERGELREAAPLLLRVPLPPLAPGSYVLLEVTDTGCGMSEEVKARAFEPFFSTKFPGRGLGLAAVQGIVRGHGGRVRVSSPVGEGTQFQVLLPALLETRNGIHHPESTPMKGGKTILIVEDDPAVRSLAALVLAGAGYTIVQAGDGQVGLEMFRQRPDDFEAVLLDLTMPRLDGLEVLAELRQLRPEVPVVLMTGYSTKELARRPGAPAANALLQKPFTSEALLEVIKQAVKT